MSNWIDEEAEKFREFAMKSTQRAQIIARSQFWSQLRQQVESDAAVINRHPVWKQALGDENVTVHDIENGFEIRKLWLPAVYVRVVNEGYDIHVETEIAESIEEAKTSAESLRVIESNGRVQLKGERGSYLVPEQASKHFFEPILKSFRAIYTT